MKTFTSERELIQMSWHLPNSGIRWQHLHAVFRQAEDVAVKSYNKRGMSDKSSKCEWFKNVERISVPVTCLTVSSFDKKNRMWDDMLTMKPSPMYWPHPIIGGVDQIKAHISEAATIRADRRLLRRRVMTKYRSMAMNAKQLIELRPAVAAENAYIWQPAQQSQHLFNDSSISDSSSYRVDLRKVKNWWKMCHGNNLTPSASGMRFRVSKENVRSTYIMYYKTTHQNYLFSKNAWEITNLGT